MRRREFTKLALAGAVGAVGAPAAVKARTALHENAAGNEAKRTKRIDVEHCCGLIIDVQDSFLSQLDGYRRTKILLSTKDFAHLLGLFKIPIVVTLEKPIDKNGASPQEISEELNDLSKTFEKAFFDLSREQPIREHIAGLNRRQVIVAGCETDVCVLQSCLGLLNLGYEVYMAENLLFTASPDVTAAIARMKAEGAIFISYKSLFYELTATVENETALMQSGPVTKDLSR
jgi:nicotinamidase-related amidase